MALCESRVRLSAPVRTHRPGPLEAAAARVAGRVAGVARDVGAAGVKSCAGLGREAA